MLMSFSFLLTALIQFALGLVVAFILGPEVFGVYALGVSAAVLGQTLVFEWLRLSITRFYHAGQDEAFRFRLGWVMRMLAVVSLGVSALLLAFGGQQAGVYAMLPLLALAAGYADYHAAFARALFHQRAYAALQLLRNIAAILLLPLSAWLFGRAEAVLAAFALSTVLATLLFRLLPLSRPAPGEDVQHSPIAWAEIARYSLPIILTNLTYLALFFALRSWVALRYGLGAAGQFSLALEFGLKLVMTFGTALDLFLFQVALKEAREQGEGIAGARLRLNAQIILALLVPMVVGLWLILPHVEASIIAPKFREIFSAHLAVLLPGLLLFGIIQYVLHPFLQLAGRTLHLAAAGMLALVLAFGVLALWPQGGAGQMVDVRATGLAVGLSMAGGVTILLIRIGMVAIPGAGFWLKMVICLAAMLAATWPLRVLSPGWLAGGLTILCGMAAYILPALVLNLARLRDLVRQRRLPSL